MTRTKLKDRILPSYTKGEEIFNMVSHIVGCLLGIIASVICIAISAVHQSTFGIVSGAIYGATIIILYVMSSIYHGLSPNLISKKIFQILDHNAIFLLIAGTYTPFILCGIRIVSPVFGWWILGIIWGIAILGIVLNSIDLKMFKKFSMICYLAMGWCVIIRANILPDFLPTIGIIMLILGGVLYTIGAIFYCIGKKKNIRYAHSIFHLFVLIATLLHFLCIALYLL